MALCDQLSENAPYYPKGHNIVMLSYCYMPHYCALLSDSGCYVLSGYNRVCCHL